MKKQLKDKLPQWIFEKNTYAMEMQNDWDSLLSTCLLKHLNGWDINYFYNFKERYILDNTNDKEKVGVDLALRTGKTVCNHVMLQNHLTVKNHEAVNLNSILGIHNGQYYKKFPLSTFMLLISIFDFELNYDDECLIKFILCVDSAYKGFYTKNDHFKKIYVDWMELLGLDKFLDVLEKTPKEDFEDMLGKMKEFGTNITIDENGCLKFGRNNLKKLSKRLGFTVELPKGQFKQDMQFINGIFEASRKSSQFYKDENVYSYAFTKRDIGKVSYIKAQ